jgi:hypothetical protein
MRISVGIELFLNPEILQKEKVDKDQALNLVLGVVKDSLNTVLVDFIQASVVTGSVIKEGPKAAN